MCHVVDACDEEQKPGGERCSYHFAFVLLCLLCLFFVQVLYFGVFYRLDRQDRLKDRPVKGAARGLVDVIQVFLCLGARLLVSVMNFIDSL